ncbi:MerR family transcriptional regulator [Neobacillus cucumis]|uniref:MerR family transcriptional regulator n=1 Tax=Neobacillus cucumis TaxID=1740721 RepID=UPI00196618D9|nr:MerR family transcriptional regulator [Neobacillus cucumis]MBM7652067.1 DNA-binding transcriptional MerR regulator [Neobacillus cucumis]MDR4949246.1 MerR family transcriptional regulator [Neobacillus cucumis]MED4228677.1 MerR family transcriptional regulator [Neobacillus cucumis]
MDNSQSYREKKVIGIGTVTEITGLSNRKIRYYEMRKLIFPDRTPSGTRKYSFSDIERLMEIAEKIEDGVQTHEIRKDIVKKEKHQMIKGQLNSHFHTNRYS